MLKYRSTPYVLTPTLLASPQTVPPLLSFSFSTDHNLLDLNLPGVNKNVIGTFCIETSIAVEDDRRLRSMLVYGFSRKLNRIVLFDEERDKGQEGGEGSIQEQVLSKVENIEDPSARMLEIQKAAAKGAKKAKDEAAIAGGGNDGKSVVVETFSPQLRKLCGGTWVGDGVIRNNSAGGKNKNGGGGRRKKGGFGGGEGMKSNVGAGLKDGFAEWSVNVFKSDLSFQWDGQVKRRGGAK